MALMAFKEMTSWWMEMQWVNGIRKRAINRRFAMIHRGGG